MRTLLSAAIVFAAISMLSPSTAEAQYQQGYQFGAGVYQKHHGYHSKHGHGFGGVFGGCITPREQPPYFAKFPPVYYSGIVPRPYGFSPYALPPGIPPAETCVPVPMTVKNPFFEGQVAPVSEETETKDSVDADGNKVTTWQQNPFVDTFVIK